MDDLLFGGMKPVVKRTPAQDNQAPK